MNQTSDEQLDRLTRIVARGGGIGEDEAERIGSSPFLHARLRARIESEFQRPAEQGSGWFATLLVASRAVAALLLVTIAAALAFWVSRANAPVSNPAASPAADNISRVVTGGTCALSTTDECAISTEEVLATLFADEGGKEPK
ncbi:MAG: hypothetical protein AABO57_19040 [Acidobacteriota bacterium]